MLEVCDGVDQNCNVQIDEGTKELWYIDSDGDGYGAPEDVVSAMEACLDANPSGYVLNDDDCNDDSTLNADGVMVGTLANPSLLEMCDEVDNDCDGFVDEPDAQDATTWYPDFDSDGFGSEAGTLVRCEQPAGYLNVGGDCNDGRSNVNPQALEDCDTAYDDDCDGDTNDLNADNCTEYFLDSDGDGFGVAGQSECRCDPQGQYISRYDNDCDDQLSSVSPNEIEDCLTIYDDDCDGQTDALGAANCTLYYYDFDGDGHGVDSYECWCEPHQPFSAETLDDCDDSTFCDMGLMEEHMFLTLFGRRPRRQHG